MDNLGVNEKNNLTIGGADVACLCEQYGTPLYIMDENKIRANCAVYKNAIDKYYDGNGIALYASKAFSCLDIYRIVNQEGLGVDVVSGGELYTALKAGFPADRIYFHGNNKTNAEIELGIENNIRRFVVDNKYELERINEIAGACGKKVSVSFRIKPGIDAHTHDFVLTGQIDSKFGVALETGEAEEIIAYALGLENVTIDGVHCHIGSQIFDLDPFVQAAEKMLSFLLMIKEKYGHEIGELNLGGGFGIKYTEQDDPIEYDLYIEKVSEFVKAFCKKNNFKLPYIVMEPGRSIVASSGITAYTVGMVKNIPDVRTYVSVDGGMSDNPRYIMYGAEYDALKVHNPYAERTDVVTIAGRCCESGDILIKDIKMPKINEGDLLCVLATGAYNYSMASNYNRVPRPPVVMVKDGESRVVIKRESYEDIIRNDV